MKKIYKYFVLAFVLSILSFQSNAQSVSGLSNSSYTEGGAPYIIDNDVVVTGANSWGGGYLLYNFSNANVGDQLNLLSDPNPNVNGAVSHSGGVLYLGNGTGTDVIGSIDPIQNGQNGAGLKVNFSSNFANSSFESGLGGWTVGNSFVNLGVTQIAGFTTPNDPTNPANAGNDDVAPRPTPTFNYELSASQYTEGTHSLRLYSQMTTSTGCDVVHGPYVYSDVFQSAANDVIYFDWRAYAGWDAYDVFGYILNVNTGATTVVLNATGSSYGSTSNWATASVTIPANGSYRFVFVSGTWDATCGLAAGASLYIDNVRVFGNRVTDAVVSKIANMVTYHNVCGTTNANRNLGLTVVNSTTASASANAQILLNTIAPTAICKNIDAYLTSNGTVTVAENAIDNGSYDNCALTFNTDVNTFNCNNLGVNNVVLTVYDSYGTPSTCPATITVYDQVPPSVITQNITLPLDGSGIASITTSSVDNGSYDACGIASMTISNSSFNCSNLGANSVTLTVTDVNGNISSANAIVTIIDNMPPVVVAQNATIYLDANGLASITTSNIHVSSTDNCGIASISLDKLNFDCSNVGANNVTLTVTDVNGNVTNSPVVVTVVDNINPTISGPANITVSATSASGANVNFASPTGSDNCSYTISQVAGMPSGSMFPIGTTTISYIITDASNNSAQFSFDITVNGIAPQINCPANITIYNGIGQCGSYANFAATITDGIPSPTLSYSHPSGSFFPVGTTTVTVTATNIAGSTSCSFDVVIVDNIAPSISCAFDITVNAEPGLCGATVNYNAPSATDNCGSGTLPTSIPGYTFKGTYGGHTYFMSNSMAFPEDAHAAAVSLGGHLATISDVAENTFISNMSPQYMWIGHTDRAVEGQWKWITSESVSYTNWAPGEPNNAGNEDWAVINWGSSMWNDWYFTAQAYYVVEFDGGTLPTALVSGLASGSFFPVGVNTVTYSATDPSGNISTCSFNVTVIDNQPPTVNCPADINVYATSAAGAVVSFTPPTGNDNCAIASVVQIAGIPNGSTYPIGNSSVSYQVTDTRGFSAQCSFNINITGLPPVIECPADITVNNDAANCSAIVNFAATETTAIPPSTISYSIAPGSVFNVGTTQVTATATNPVGTSVCTFNIIVVDNEQPTVLTQNQTINLDANGQASVSAAQINNGSTDNCGIATLALSQTNFNCSEVGANSVTLTVTDIHGNFNSSSAVVTVVDAILPTVLTQNVTIYLDANGQASTSVSAINNGSFDNCAIATLVLDKTDFTCAEVGNNTVTLTATDVNGNVNSTTAIVNVVDAILPTVLTQNITIQLDATGNASITTADINNGTFDNCAVATLSVSPSTFSCSEVGQNTVVLTATDVNGNINSATSVVTVEDNIAPVVNGCPANITINNLYNNCFQMVVYTPPTFSDACGIDTVFFSNNAGVVCYQAACCANQVQGAFPVGVTTVTYTAIDVNGNVTTCSFTVTVVDTEPPTLNNCPADITLNVNPGTCERKFVYWTPPTPSDNCPSWSMTASHFPSQTFPVGTTTVSYMLVDNAGDTVSCSFNVTIVDNEAPTAICQNLTIYLDANGQASISAQNVDNGSFDNCGIQSLTLSQYNFDCGHVGQNTVTLSVLDIHGNTSTCQATITVIDNLIPFAIAKDITVALDANGQSSITANDVDNGSYDNCAFTLAVSPSTFDCSNTGANTVTLTATDASGNISTTTAIVTVIDNLAPVVITQNATVYLDANGQASIISGDVNNGTYDNCSFTVAVMPNTFDCSNVGANTVTLTATDASANTSSNTAIVTVIDAIAPTVITQNVTIYLDANGSASISTTMVDNGSFDNCSVASLVLNQTQFDCSNLGINTVTLTVTDVNNNVSTGTATITVIDQINPTIVGCPADITVNAIPSSCSNTASWIAPSASDNCTVISLTSNFNSGDIFPLGSTVVTYTATDNSGNISTCSFTVTVVPTPLVISFATSNYNGNNISCNGSADGSIDITLTGGCLPYSFNWSNGANTEDVSGLTAGTYTVIATDANGAIISLSVTLTQPDALNGVITSNSYAGGFNVSCNGASDGMADLSVLGGTSPYTYVWSNGSTTQDLSSLIAGTYTVTISDLNGCSTIAQITLTEPDQLTASLNAMTYSGGFNTSCNGLTDGMISTDIIGGFGPYTFLWSDGSTDDNLDAIGAGSYSVSVVDQNGCSAVANIILTEPTKLIANAGNDTAICDGQSAQIGGYPSAYGGVAPYNFYWLPNNSINNQVIANPIANPSATTLFDLTVVDANGCAAIDQVNVVVNPLPVVSITMTIADTFCRKVDLIANGSANTVYYSWSNGAYGSVLHLDPETANAGVYSVISHDVNGCQSAPASYNYDPTNFLTSYTIIAFKDMNLGERNYVQSGSVGLTGVGRTAKVMKYAEINGPNAFLKADNIQAMSGSIVPTKYYDPAVVGLPTMKYYSPSNIKYTVNVNDNAVVTVNTNMRNIKIGKNATVIITGTDFGTIEIDRGSKVMFTASNINVKRIITKKAYSSKKTEINFSFNTTVRVQDDVRIEENVLVNYSNNAKVFFYIGEKCSTNSHSRTSSDADRSCNDDGDDDDDDNENEGCNSGYMQVHPNGVTFNASVMIPNGQLQVHQDASVNCPGFMNGQFIAKYFHAEAKYVFWNWNACQTTTTYTVVRTEDQESNIVQDDLKLKVYPNPARETATVEFSSPAEGNISVDIYSLVGQKVKTLFNGYATEGQVQTLKVDPADLEMGVYYIRLTAGEKSLTQKLVIIK